MKIVSYNVNGIRAAVKKGFLNWLQKESPDVLCLQETKAQEEQIPIMDFAALGYKTFVFSARKKGYSGVAILTKSEPKHIELGMGVEKYDYEGRVIRVDFDNVSIVSVYHPSGSSGELRQAFKMQWLEDFYTYSNALKKKLPNLVIAGDYNICHTPMDIHDPIRNKKSSGFLPEEREWVTKFLESGFTDSFRYINPDLKDEYSWWSYRANARNNNKGWRIDYNMVSNEIKSKIVDAKILQEVKHSDHCPVVLILDM